VNDRIEEESLDPILVARKLKGQKKMIFLYKSRGMEAGEGNSLGFEAKLILRSILILHQ